MAHFRMIAFSTVTAALLAVSVAGCASAPARLAAKQPGSLPASEGAEIHPQIVSLGAWGVLASGVRIRVVDFAPAAGDKLPVGFPRQPSGSYWIVATCQNSNAAGAVLDPNMLGLCVVYPNMVMDDPDDDGAVGTPRALVARGRSSTGSAASLATDTIAFPVAQAAFSGPLSLRAATPSGTDEYFRLR